MAKKAKFYVIWKGHSTGIFSDWKEAEQQIKGFAGAQYKSFDSLAEANEAHKKNYWQAIGVATKSSKNLSQLGHFITPSIAVDAACAGNPGKLEYQGVDTATKQVIFAKGPFPVGTVNLGEFLAIVHGLAFLKKENMNFPLYSDSRTAIAWVRNKAIKTNLERNAETEALFQLVDRALEWLHQHSYTTKILKWETEAWGENPADYGRK